MRGNPRGSRIFVDVSPPKKALRRSAFRPPSTHTSTKRGCLVRTCTFVASPSLHSTRNTYRRRRTPQMKKNDDHDDPIQTHRYAMYNTWHTAHTTHLMRVLLTKPRSKSKKSRKSKVKKLHESAADNNRKSENNHPQKTT